MQGVKRNLPALNRELPDATYRPNAKRYMSGFTRKSRPKASLTNYLTQIDNKLEILVYIS